MVRARLSPEQEAAVRAVRRAAPLSPAEGDRVEMVLLSAAGWSPPWIAADGEGNVYVADTGNDRIQVLTASDARAGRLNPTEGGLR